jgi:type I restriction enzyme, S subunit
MVDVLNENPFIFYVSPQELTKQVYRMDLNFYHPKFLDTLSFIDQAAKHNTVKKLGEIAEVTRILGFETQNLVKYQSTGIPYLRVQNIKEFEISQKGIVYISKEAHDKLTRSQLKPRDVVMTITGRVGTAAVIPVELGECNASQEIVRIRINTDKILPEYLAIYLNSSIGKNLLGKSNSGSTRLRTLIKNVRNIPIIFPSKKKQDEITNNVLELKRNKNLTLMDAVILKEEASEVQMEGYRNVYRLLGIKQQKSERVKIFKLQEIELKDRLDVRYYSQEKNFSLTEIYPLRKVSELAEFSHKMINPEVEPFREFTYIQIHDVDAQEGIVKSSSFFKGKDAPCRARRIIKAGNIIMALTRARGSIAIVPKELDGSVASTGFAVLIPFEFVDTQYLYFMLRSSYFLNEIERRLAGVATPAINLSAFKSILIPLPPFETQIIIVNMLIEARNQSEKKRKQSKDLIERSKEMDVLAEKALKAALLGYSGTS